MRCEPFIFTRGGVNTRLTALADGIVRVTRTLRNTFLPENSPAAVLRGPAEAEVTEVDGETVFSAGQVRVHIRDGVMTFVSDSGTVLLREPSDRPCVLQEKPVMLNRFDPAGPVREERSIDGARAYAMPAESFQDRTAYEARQNFVFSPDEGLYGLGSHEEGVGNLRGHSRMLYQQNMKAVVPVLVSTAGWGILFDMGCMMAFHDDEDGSCLWADCADELSWVFFYGGGSYASLMSQYRRLTGETPLLPRYALGFVQSKERYKDAAELLDIAREYRQRGIPLDLIVLDWQSWPENQWGWKCFDAGRFPDPKGLTDALHAEQIRLMISIWPSMQGERNEDRKEMLEKGFMLGNQTIYNAFIPEARTLYWRQASRGLFSQGVDAWWCDCTEPFESDWHGAVKPEPAIRAVMNTEEAKRYLDPAKLSLYSLYHSQGIWEGQRTETRKKRVCNLTRSSWAGQHRYATVTWSGDVSATWETLRRHVPEGMNFCAAGEGYWSTDIGGFFPGRANAVWFIDGDYDDGMADAGYRELFVRWAQYAAFLPMMRAHGTGTPREVWRLGEKGTRFYDAMVRAIRLRYHLIPYLYTLMAQLNREGIPMLRIPALVFPEDDVLREIDDQMMLGDSLLIKPVTRPMYYLPHSEPLASADETETVRLPKGHLWYALEEELLFRGGQSVAVSAPLERVPVFVRSGTILPWGGDAASSDAQSALPLELIVFPGEDGRLLFYDDDGDGDGCIDGVFDLIDMRWNDSEKKLTLAPCQETPSGMNRARIFLVHLRGQPASEIIWRGEKTEITL